MFPQGDEGELRDSMNILNEGADDVAPRPGVAPPKDKDGEPGVVEPITEEEEPVVEEEEEELDEDGKPKVKKEEEEEEVELPVVQAHARPTVSDIKTKFPDFFKTFPEMKHVLFREAEYTNVFPTVDDAKEAQEKAGDFDNYQGLLSSGKAADFAQFLKGVDEAKGLPAMAANFLPSLYSVNRDMYFQVTGPIAESLLRNAFKTGNAQQNENLKNAALHIAAWAFGDPQYASGEKSTPPIKVEEEKGDPAFDKEKKDFYQARYNEAQDFVKGTSYTRLVADIRKGLDPNNAFKPYLQNLIVKEIINEIGTALEADKTHIATMNSMWKQAHKAGYAGNWKDRILATYLSRARQVMPAIRAKARTSALAQERSTAEQTRTQAVKSADRREVQGSATGRSGGSTNGAGPVDASKVDWSKTSDIDFLNDKITLRK